MVVENPWGLKLPHAARLPPDGERFMWTPTGPVEIRDDDSHIVKCTIRNIQVVDGVRMTRIDRQATIRSYGWDPGDGDWVADELPS